jgi:carbonic anhydrase/acetyltransferase-like protein (isoleucine patch superfamily)
MTCYGFNGKEPQLADDVFVAPTATLIGDVELGSQASVWFGAVLRADFDRIVVGAGSCVQDNAVVHAAEGLPTIVGANVTVGHAAMLEGCVIEDGAVVGMGAIVLQRARLGAGAMLAAGAVLSERREIGPGMLAAGVPAVEKKPLSDSAQGWVDTAAEEYQHYRRRYLATGVLIEGS